MRMMAFITPLTQISNQIRDSLIDVLRKAMYHSDINTRKLSVFGFCNVLKQLRQNNARRGSSALNGSQLTISGYSLLSQSMNDPSRNSHHHFDIMVLEIMGILRKCLNQTHEIKEILYDSLAKAADANLKLTPHIIQFLELHFRSYFRIADSQITINFEKCVNETDEGFGVKINDQLGKLTKCLGHCVLVCEQGSLEYDASTLLSFFNDLINHVYLIDSDALGIVSVSVVLSIPYKQKFHFRFQSGAYSAKNNQVASQYVNCLEALMYLIMKQGPTDDQPLTKIIDLFERHAEVTGQMKTKYQQLKKGTKRKANAAAVTQSSAMANAAGLFNPTNIWTLSETYQFLMAINCPSDRYPADQTEQLRQDNAFNEYLMTVTIAKLDEMHTAPSYLQIKYSKSSYTALCSTAQLVFRLYIKNCVDLLNDGKLNMACLSIDCFRKCLIVADFMYKRKFNEFLKLIGRSQSCASSFMCSKLHIFFRSNWLGRGEDDS